MKQRTDKELLDLAAKAAGLKIIKGRDCTGMHDSMNIYAANLWNPLTDDGDALRLAVKLNALVDINNGKTACVLLGPETDSVQHDSDPYAATRRAIVRAAAEIGAKL
jgi:hypothetical protein